MKYLLSLLSIAIGIPAISQHEGPIMLTNPSFEGTPIIGDVGSKLPDGWFDCGFPEETPPDVHLLENNPFGVEQLAYDGNTYIGMVVRENDTWERVSQRLSAPLVAGNCYEFSLHLSRSLYYMSPTQSSNGKMFNYTSPAQLRIWGGNGYCARAELLAVSGNIINSRWLEYNFKFEPSETHTYIVLEAYYRTPILFPYNGNVLVDNASPIMPVPCDIETPEAPPLDEPVVQTDTPEKPLTQPDTVPKTEPEKPKILAELDRSTIRQGQTIQIDQLYFKSDSFAITPPSYPVLDEVYDFLSENPDVIVEIGGHTNNIPTHEYCDRLSTQRAKAVADYLSGKGILKARILFKGYGKRHPVVSNSTIAGRRKNQRVEVKILSFDG